ncbi:hypothetical protein EB796_014706 [Bugula neritina]|uniref:C2H2-type domain-containing protein n=1 Tax=Bugula neritina TaxID=10212 RepID=A0A7J7JLM7_BUGNE|nr:hypothetical protein EB796_014706 [Bugula neritina]
MSDSAIGESANPNYQQKQLDNGFKDAPCFVCGSVGLNGHQSLTESLYNILVKTRTVISSDKTNSICSTCSTSSELMEQAVQAQLSLAEKNRKRLGVTKNGSNITSLATHLLKAGSAVNMSGNVHQAQTDVDNENDEENLNLLISNIQGGLGQTDQGELKQTDLSQVDQPDIDNEFSIISEYNSPQQVEIPRLECEIFEHEDLTRNSPSSNDNIRMGFLSHYQNDLGSESASDWKCPMCYLVFESSPDLIDHVRSVHSETRTGEYMTCPFCTKSFPTYAQFDDHVTKMHGDGSYSCQGCHSVFLRSTLLRRHQQLCKQYKNVLEQNRDTDTTKATAVSTCSLCLIKFSSALLLAEHVNSCHTDSLSKKYNCEGCKAGFDLLKGLYSHQNECMVYLGLKKTSIDSSYSVLFRCHGCPKVFNDYGNFQLHKQVCKAVKDMLNIEDRVDQEEESVSVEVSDSVLDLAQEDISSKLNHSSNTPAVASPPDIIGTGCQEKFLEVEQLTNHEVVYKDKVEPKMKEFVCEICVISFDYKCLLDFHKLVHKDPERKPYRCIGCNAGFVARTHKIDHESKCGKVRNMNNFVKHNKASSESDSIVPEAASCIEKHSATNKEGSVELELDQCSNPTNSAKSFWCKGCSKQFAFFCDFENHLAFCLKPVGANPDDQGDAMDCASESSACKDMSEGENCSESNESSVCNSMTGANSSGFIECPICGVEIASISDRKRSGKVQKHVAGHDEPARRYCCVGCRWSCDFRALFIAHSKQCKVLFKQYPLKNNSSAGVNCPACFIHFSDISQCKEHFFSCHYSASKVTNTEMLSCDGCQGSFNSLDDLENHQDNCLLFRRSGPAINAHKNRRCGICNVDFAARFPNHFADFHSIKSLVDFTCAVCNDKFANLDNLILHVTNSCLLSQVIIAEQLSNTGTNQIETCINDERTPSDEESVISEASSKASGGRCQFCGIPRVKPNHILIHINSEERPYRCSGCKGGFLRPYSLQVHERSCVALKNTKAIGLSTGKVVDSTVMFEKPNIGSVESKIEAVGKLGDIPMI